MKIEGVLGAHDLHVWTISPDNVALTVHITIKSEPLSYCQEIILEKIQEMLCLKYIIHHSTIQVEKNKSIHCNPAFCTNYEIQ
jgi:Co/Zn/Cd efflux system component